MILRKIIILTLIVFLSVAISANTKLSYNEFSLGMNRTQAEKIVKDIYMAEYTVNFNAVNNKDNNIIEIKHKEIHNKYVFLYFNEKNVLYSIIVWVGYLDLQQYDVLVRTLIKKYNTPYNRKVENTGYPSVGWVFQNKKYQILCFYEDSVESVLVTYTDIKLRERYEAYLYEPKDNF